MNISSKNSAKKNLLKQISEGVEKILRDFLGFEKSFADVDQLCSGTWKISDFEKFYVDRSRNENEGKFSICTENFFNENYRVYTK